MKEKEVEMMRKAQRSARGPDGGLFACRLRFRRRNLRIKTPTGVVCVPCDGIFDVRHIAALSDGIFTALPEAI
jgi:hypothetical protein